MKDKLNKWKKIMMLLLSIIPLSTLCQNLNLETDSTIIHPNFTSDSSFIIFDDTELFVEFPGGEKAMNRFIKQNLSYPEIAVKNKIEGVVHVNFIIDCYGKISDVKIVKGSNPYLDGEVISLISIMPSWIWDKQIKMDNVVKNGG